jgi:hypothetical protein
LRWQVREKSAIARVKPLFLQVLQLAQYSASPLDSWDESPQGQTATGAIHLRCRPATGANHLRCRPATGANHLRYKRGKAVSLSPHPTRGSSDAAATDSSKIACLRDRFPADGRLVSGGIGPVDRPGAGTARRFSTRWPADDLHGASEPPDEHGSLRRLDSGRGLSRPR